MSRKKARSAIGSRLYTITWAPKIIDLLLFVPTVAHASVDRQDDVPGLLLRFDIPRRLDHVFQRVRPIDDRPDLPGLDELPEEEYILLRLPGRDLENHLLASEPWRPEGQDEILKPVGGQV